MGTECVFVGMYVCVPEYEFRFFLNEQAAEEAHVCTDN